MALTNIASVSEETKNRIVSEPHALSTIQYLQFSDHELVRRAVTETICNLIPNEIVIDRLFKNEEKLCLWLAFASIEEEEEDFETCRAASGALAMVSQVPKVSQLIVKLGGISMLSKLVKGSKHEESVHRAIFALENVLTTLARQVCPIPSLSDDVSDQVIQQVRDDMEKHGEELIEELGRLIKSKSGGVPSLKEQART